jgi:hypothetical protein
MTVQDIMIILSGIGALLVSLGTAAKWILTYIDEKTKEALKRADASQSELRTHLEREIKTLTEQLNSVSRRETLYFRRILQLENYLREKGLDLPTMDGWPPES